MTAADLAVSGSGGAVATAPAASGGDAAAVRPMTVFWIGCGVMGRWMAEHVLVHGPCSRLVVFSRTAAKCEPLAAAGAYVVPSIGAGVRERPDVIFAMVGFPHELEAVVFGKGGVLEAVDESGGGGQAGRPAPLFIDMSTTSPALSGRIAAAFAARGGAAVDAPVSGGDVGARTRKLSIMAGGSEAAFAAAAPFLAALTDNPARVQRLGGPGAGQHTKMANQIAVAGCMIGACEALVYAARAGLDSRQCLAVIAAGAAGSWTLTNLAPRILASDFAPGFFVEHFLKDLRLALDECRRMGIALPGLSLAENLYTSLVAAGGGKLGTQALMHVLKTINPEKKES